MVPRREREGAAFPSERRRAIYLLSARLQILFAQNFAVSLRFE